MHQGLHLKLHCARLAVEGPTQLTRTPLATAQLHLEKPQVHDKMPKFHAHMENLCFTTCTCAESLPATRFHELTNEGIRCSRVSKAPKLYLNGNNMHPQLQVCFAAHTNATSCYTFVQYIHLCAGSNITIAILIHSFSSTSLLTSFSLHFCTHRSLLRLKKCLLVSTVLPIMSIYSLPLVQYEYRGRICTLFYKITHPLLHSIAQ